MSYRHATALALLGWCLFLRAPAIADNEEDDNLDRGDRGPVEADLYDGDGHHYRGEVQDGYGVFRTPDGHLRGSVDEDGYGTLHDDDGNRYRVKPK
jgi:hypothetical protein